MISFLLSIETSCDGLPLSRAGYIRLAKNGDSNWFLDLMIGSRIATCLLTDRNLEISEVFM